MINHKTEISLVDSKDVYKNRWMTVREDRVERANGTDGIFGVVDKPDYALIIPFDGVSFHMVEQFRYPVGGRYWEFPQGSWEHSPKADPTDIARGELAEETGLRAGSIRKIGKLFQAYGYSNQSVHIFLATNLTQGATSLDAEEHGLISANISIDEVDTMLSDGRISDVSTVAAFHLFKRAEKSN